MPDIKMEKLIIGGVAGAAAGVGAEQVDKYFGWNQEWQRVQDWSGLVLIVGSMLMQSQNIYPEYSEPLAIAGAALQTNAMLKLLKAPGISAFIEQSPRYVPEPASQGSPALSREGAYRSFV